MKHILIALACILIVALIAWAGSPENKRIHTETLRQILDVYYPQEAVDSLMTLDRCAIGDRGAIVHTSDYRYIWLVTMDGKATVTIKELITEGAKKK